MCRGVLGTFEIKLERIALHRFMLNEMEDYKGIRGWELTMLITTCFFHAGGFFSPLQFLLSSFKATVVFNHGDDIDKGNTCEILYNEVDQYKPGWMMCGSHHLVLLSKQRPKNKTLDLKSVWVVSPMGSTVPNTLYEDLKQSLTSLGM